MSWTSTPSSSTGLIKLLATTQKHRCTLFQSKDKNLSLQLTKASRVPFGSKKLNWKISGSKGGLDYILQQAAPDQPVLVTKSDGSAVTSMTSPGVGKTSFDFNNKTYTWKVFRTLWRLQLTLLDESTQKQVAVLDLNGTTFGSYWKPSDDSVSIRGDKEDKAWLGVVIATGMAVAKYEKQRFKSQLGSEKANCKDDMYEPKRFSMEMYRASSLRSALST